LELKRWLELYSSICIRLGLDPSRDMESARLLAGMLAGRCLTSKAIGESFASRRIVVIFGAGPSLECDLDHGLPIIDDARILKVAADGACGALLDHGMVADVVVTDLDGRQDHLLESSERGSIMVVHAHGDNMDRILDLVPSLKGAVLGTTQTYPIEPLENFGGFTDGDRALCMFEELGFPVIMLAGMDFGDKIGPYSKPYNLSGEALSRKLIKLQIGLEICVEVAGRGRARFYDLTSGSDGIPGFQKLSWREVGEMVMSGHGDSGS